MLILSWTAIFYCENLNSSLFLIITVDCEESSQRYSHGKLWSLLGQKIHYCLIKLNHTYFFSGQPTVFEEMLFALVQTISFLPVR